MNQLAPDPTAVSMRQVLAQGRFYEAITNRGFVGFHATLSYSHAAGEGVFVTTQTILREGYFALHFDPSSAMPDFSQVASVTLTLTLVHASAAPVIAHIEDVDVADLSLEQQQHTINNQLITVSRVSGAPFVFNISIEPQPILLDGLLLHNHDPEEPAVGVAVTILGDAGITIKNTDDEGRFRITALPISETVTLQFNDNGTLSQRTVRPAWGNGSMAQTFSLPSS